MQPAALAVRVLNVTEYPPTGHGYTTRSHPNPSWEQIEAAIRALNHYVSPFVTLGLGQVCEGENIFSVFGGPNGYAISAEVAKRGWVNYCDPSHTGGEVAVWTSDQGYYPEERYVTYDLELVLRLARYYAETGELAPFVCWEE